MQRKTKIICTIGPAVDTREKLMDLARCGMNVARLNFSHGNHENFQRVIQDLRSIEEELGEPIGILGDIQGPKIRVGTLKNKTLQLREGESVWMTSDEHTDDENVITSTYKDLCKDVSVGQFVLLDDGLLRLKIVEKSGGRLKAVVVNGGTLLEHKGISVPEASFSVHSITEKDYSDILFCVKAKVDFIALSFVRSAQEVRHIKQFVQSRETAIKIISKVEKREALECLEEIIDASDGILVARGDLAVEVGNPRVPVLQKKIVRRCNLKAKPVIIATQMLMSMVENPQPTRAEASDVANAILDGADAIMLSNETAVGRYPLEAVKMMNQIAVEIEAEPRGQAILYNEWELNADGEMAIALLQSAVRLASILQARAIVVMTRSGYSSQLISKCRAACRVISVTSNFETYRQLSMHWGVEAILVHSLKELSSEASPLNELGDVLIDCKKLIRGDRVVFTAGLPEPTELPTNTIKVWQL
ncbi:MAG: pyruvate kinase [Bdellovibrionota bacterium]